MKKNITRSGLVFTCVWLAIFAVAYIIWTFFLSSLTAKLAEYEYSHPENEAQKVFTQYFLNTDPMHFSSYDDVETKYDVQGSAQKYYYDLTYGKAFAFAECERTEEAVTYAVTADGLEFARIVLVESDTGAWEYDKIILTARPSNEILINVPKLAVVTVNGVILDENYAASEYMLPESAIYGEDVEKRTMVTYCLQG